MAGWIVASAFRPSIAGADFTNSGVRTRASIITFDTWALPKGPDGAINTRPERAWATQHLTILVGNPQADFTDSAVRDRASIITFDTFALPKGPTGGIATRGLRQWATQHLTVKQFAAPEIVGAYWGSRVG